MSSLEEPTLQRAGFPRPVVIHALAGLTGLMLGAVGVSLGVLYPLCALLIVGMGLVLWFSRRGVGCFLRHQAKVLLLLLLPTIWLQVHLPGDWQDWSDETPQAAAALRIHFDREASYPEVGIFALPDGPLLLGDRGGSGVFSALAALVHDLTGERPGNVRMLNGLIAYALLAILWFTIRKLAGVKVSLAVFALFVLTPLLSLLARGGGEHLLLTTLILAACVAGFGDKQSSLTKLATPLLWLVACVTLSAWLVSGDWSPEGIASVPAEILFRLFSPEAQEPASPLLMTAGVAAGILLAMNALKKGNTQPLSAGRLFAALFFLSSCGLAVSFRREISGDTPWCAPHLLLPHVAATLALAWALGQLETQRPLPWKWLGPVFAGALLLWAVPRLTQPVSALFLRLDGRRVIRDFAREQPRHISAFYALDRPEGLIAERFSAGPPSLLAPSAKGSLPPLMSSRLFAKFYVLTTATLNPRTGIWEPDSWQKLPEGLESLIVRERWISMSRKAFVHEVVGVRWKESAAATPLVEPLLLGSGPRMPTADLIADLESQLESSK